MADGSTVQVRDNPEAGCFELSVDGQPAGQAEYQAAGGTVTMTHTEIYDAYGGRGLGSTLIKAALDALRERGASVIPECPFVRSYLQRHSEYAAMVPLEERSRFELPDGE
ncbi:N-acetyltransferase [Acidiferrimicrobium sp. IK]|uniref:GNAT family N-acetyltransferase n=1 Tax=Acidiferrimicrobium sp. IK TaxID=2871700 RepID=UPI0021CB14A5|nr:GNAT family N-acetyltransferase [Acidiferrimicrobium sp. IK]MCU4185893.1 N-acetyltransferase [Acidiferrimicrobium sp. IK]